MYSRLESLVAFAHIVIIYQETPTLCLTGRTEQLCGERGPAPRSHMGGERGRNELDTKVKSPLGGHQVVTKCVSRRLFVSTPYLCCPIELQAVLQLEFIIL